MARLLFQLDVADTAYAAKREMSDAEADRLLQSFDDAWRASKATAPASIEDIVVPSNQERFEAMANSLLASLVAIVRRIEQDAAMKAAAAAVTDIDMKPSK